MLPEGSLLPLYQEEIEQILHGLLRFPDAASLHHRQQIAALYVLRLGCHVLVHHILLADQLEIGVLYQLVLVSLSSVSP